VLTTLPVLSTASYACFTSSVKLIAPRPRAPPVAASRTLPRLFGLGILFVLVEYSFTCFKVLNPPCAWCKHLVQVQGLDVLNAGDKLNPFIEESKNPVNWVNYKRIIVSPRVCTKKRYCIGGKVMILGEVKSCRSPVDDDVGFFLVQYSTVDQTLPHQFA
jgi:hypothetical protein